MAPSQLAVPAPAGVVHGSGELPAVEHESDAQVDVEVLRAVPREFAIVDETSANWLIRKIVAARQYSEHVKAFAEMERRRAEREEQCLLFVYGKQLQEWAKSEIEKTRGRRKSINLPAGAVGFRSTPPQLQV